MTHEIRSFHAGALLRMFFASSSSAWILLSGCGGIAECSQPNGARCVVECTGSGCDTASGEESNRLDSVSPSIGGSLSESEVTSSGDGAFTDAGSAASCGQMSAAASMCEQASIAQGDAPLIDDFETPSSWGPALAPADGRQGTWYIYDDGTGKSFPEPPTTPTLASPGANGSAHSFRFTGDSHTSWGGGFGVLFVDGMCYDATAYDGISFFAKGSGTIYFNVLTHATQPVASGGACTCEDDSSCSCCYDTFGATISLTADWTHYRYSWSDLYQRGGGTVVPFEVGELKGFQIYTGPDDWDVWIDDVSFTR